MPVNCAALPDALLESELFGHAKGAFTDARAARKGLFLEAEGGTLFLDEIGDFPLTTQAKLLRALEEQRTAPVGGDREQAFDVRIVSATNRDLETAVEEGRFREDLYFRVNVIQVDVPPLRARGTDILLLARHFLQVFAARSRKQVVGISEAVAEKLLSYSWPGNVRELRNVIKRAVALTRYENLAVDDLAEKIRNYQRARMVIELTDPGELVPLEEIERRVYPPRAGGRGRQQGRRRAACWVWIVRRSTGNCGSMTRSPANDQPPVCRVVFRWAHRRAGGILPRRSTA